MIYLYCLLRPASEPSPGLAGVDDLAIRLERAGDIGAWVSDVSAPTLEQTVDRVRAHDRVIRSAMSEETPIPARFGQILRDREVLAAAIDARRHVLNQCFDTVRGAVEMTIRWQVRADASDDATGREKVADESVADAGAGRAYLLAIASEHRRERNVLAAGTAMRERIQGAVSSMVRAEAYRGATSAKPVAIVSHLVSRAMVGQYREVVSSLGASAGVELRVSGPWAPYSFAELNP